MGGEQFEVYSVGTTPQSEVNSFAIEVLTERGANVDGLKPKQLVSLDRMCFDIVVNVCNNASETYPYYPYTTQTLHWSLMVPAAFQGSVEEILLKFRETRNEIERRIPRRILKQ